MDYVCMMYVCIYIYIYIYNIYIYIYIYNSLYTLRMFFKGTSGIYINTYIKYENVKYIFR